MTLFDDNDTLTLVIIIQNLNLLVIFKRLIILT